jgi:hypothetical protein
MGNGRTRLTLLVAALVATATGFQEPKWTIFRIKNAELAFSMPDKPTGSSSLLNNQQSYFYTCDAPQGRFVAGYTPIAPTFQETMKRGIATDPSSPGIMHLLDSTVASFAKGGQAKVAGMSFGMDHELPAEFATLKNDHTTLKMRVYLCSKRLYIFCAATDATSASRFFESIEIPGEIHK